MKLFVILFEQRSGSSHLVSLLNSHPEIQARGEVFDADSASRRSALISLKSDSFKEAMPPIASAEGNPSDPHASKRLSAIADFSKGYRRRLTLGGESIVDPTPARCISLIEDWLESPDHIRGFKFKFPKQVRLFPEIDERLQALGSELRVVVLRRGNIARRALSHFNHQRILSMTGKSNFRKEGIRLSPIELDMDKFVKYARRLEQMQKDFNAWTKLFSRCFHLEYESLIAESGSIYELQRFLGVNEVRQLRSQVIKATPPKLEDAILNYELFQERMLAEGWQSFLNDERSKAA